MQSSLTELRASLPEATWSAADQAELASRIAHDRRKLIVLDDDPTGIQTVHGVPVYTGWSRPEMAQLFAEDSRLCFLLTNQRALTRQDATATILSALEQIAAVSRAGGLPCSLISRGDSTLRGHWPLENSLAERVLRERLGQDIDGEIIVPCFVEGGRLTWSNQHWVVSGDQMTPVAETEFAQDRTFGYQSSDLRQWIAEKTGGETPAAAVLAISLEELRLGGARAVAKRLLEARAGRRIVVNALDYTDLKIFTLGWLQAEAAGQRFLVQTAASLLKVRGGIEDRALQRQSELISPSGRGGLVIVGSHVAKTNRQLAAAQKLPQVTPIELAAERLVGPDCAAELARAQGLLSAALQADRVALVYTSRTVLSETPASSEANLRPAGLISEALVRLVQQLPLRPRFLISKGGITSADIGTRGLGVRRALVTGQARPGIPVWQTGGESKFPGLPLVIFPGNVGDDETLADLIWDLADAQSLTD